MWWLLLATLLQGAPPQIPIRDQKPVGPGTSVLRGRVTDKETGMPLAGIVVRIAGSTVGPAAVEARTDADGVYELTRVPAGSHYLVAQMPEYRTTHLPQAYGDTGPPRASWASGRPPRLDIKAGEVRNGLDFALARAVGVGGRVIDESGLPMSNVRIRVESLGTEPVQSARVRDTDDRGEFRAFNLAPGRYRVCAEPWTFVYVNTAPPDAPATSCYPVPGTTDDALVIGTREPAPIEIVMRRGGTVTISGTVLDASGAPAEGATVTLGKRNAGFTTTYNVPIWPGAQFIARGVSPGRYFVTASGGRAVDNGQIERQYAYVPLEVGPGGLVGLAVTLSKPVNVTGRLRVDEGVPLSPGTRMSVQAFLDASIASALNRAIPTGVLRDDLTFELPGVFGEVTIACSGLPPGWIVKTVRFEGRDVTDRPFTPAGDAPSIDIVVSSRGAVAAGTVTMEAGVVAEGRALIWLFPADSSLWDASGAIRIGITSSQGTFTLDPVRAGEYFIAATDGLIGNDEPRPRPTLERLARVAQRMVLGEGERRTIEVRVVKLPEDR